MKKYNKVIILGGSRGIGKSITKYLKNNCKKIISCSSKDVDTSNLDSVKKFVNVHKATDIIVLNTGGPPPIKMSNINEQIWYKYFNQLFLSYFLILKKIKINKNGYVFFISSSIIKEPNVNLVLSSSLRTAFSSFLKSYSIEMNKKKFHALI